MSDPQGARSSELQVSDDDKREISALSDQITELLNQRDTNVVMNVLIYVLSNAMYELSRKVAGEVTTETLVGRVGYELRRNLNYLMAYGTPGDKPS